MESITELKKKLPDTPGVYFFKAGKKILYIGKATSLRNRVRSYFGDDITRTRGPLIKHMLQEAQSVKFEQTDSVLEALILEAHLIKKYQPKYNSKEKSNKSFNFLVITQEDFPQVLVIREHDILKEKFPEKDIKYVFGPFPQGAVFKEALRIVQKIFPFRDGKCMPNVGKPCFNRQIGLCPGVCTGEISKQDYARTIRHLKLFFEGRKSALVKQLEREMKMYAKKQEFEKASDIKKTLFAINHIQDIALLKKEDRGVPLIRIEGYDVAHISGFGTAGVMVVVEGGRAKKSDYRKFRIQSKKKGSDTDALKEVLVRRFGHPEWPLPKLVVLDGGRAQKNTAEKILQEYGYAIPTVSVVKNEKHRPKEILGEKKWRAAHEEEILLANREAHRFALSYHKKLRDKF